MSTKCWVITPELLGAYDEAVEEYSNHPDVTGIEIGFKYESGQRRDELAVRFLVANKVEKELKHTLPDARLLPEKILTATTDVRSGSLDFQGGIEAQIRTKRQNPIQPGISVSHGRQGAGTLGLVVYLEDGAPAILSCAHVLAHQGAIRDEPVYQPSPVDGGDPRFDAIGHLEDWFLAEEGDAAVARLTRRRMIVPGLLDILPKTEIRGARCAKLGEILTKSGRGTGVTTASVDGIGRYHLSLFGFDRPAWIEGFRLVPKGGQRVEISGPGDSGAVWFSGTGIAAQGVGLHVDGEKGDEEPEFALACHLPRVLKRLRVSLSHQPPVEPVMERPKDQAAWMEEIRQQLEEIKARLPESSNSSRAKAGTRKKKREATVVVASKIGAKAPPNGHGIRAN